MKEINVQDIYIVEPACVQSVKNMITNSPFFKDLEEKMCKEELSKKHYTFSRGLCFIREEY